jgi:hypothetical protein
MGFIHNIYKLVLFKQDMDYDKFGILLTIIIVGVLVGYALGSETGSFDSLIIPQITLPEITESEERLDNAYSNWCDAMNIECK